VKRGWPGALLLVITACGRDQAVEPEPRPVVLSASAAANANNVLSAIVTARVQLADSVAVRYGLDGAPPDQVTPAIVPSGEDVQIPVLGLLPAAQYAFQVVVYGGSAEVAAPPFSFQTGALPADLPQYHAGGADPSSGYVVFAAGMYGLVIDNGGRVMWYHRFPFGPGLNFQVQPTGRYYARPSTPTAGDFEPWIEIDPLGNVTRTFGCAGGLVARFHDLVAEADGSVWLLCDETRTMDLTALGGFANAQVTGSVVQHIAADGTLLFQWSAFDHFAITDLEAADRAGPTVNWTHANALTFDADGNLFVSFRSLSEITKIDPRTGGVIWRMGGLANQFTLQATTLPAFSRQHGLRVDGQFLLLLDNAGDPAASRAERYRYDEAAKQAWLVASYASLPAVQALLGGTTQVLPGDRTLVAYGNGGRVEEYEASGAVVWRIEGNPGYVFRAQRIQSLYRPGVVDKP
jgi:arylsulfotransferase ASST